MPRATWLSPAGAVRGAGAIAFADANYTMDSSMIQYRNQKA